MIEEDYRHWIPESEKKSAMKPTAELTMREVLDEWTPGLSGVREKFDPIYDRLCALVDQWRKPHGDCQEDKHEHDCVCPCFDDCADELATILRMEPKR